MKPIEFRSDVAVTLIDSMGGDQGIAKAARVSTLGVAAETDDKAIKGLIKFLMANRHGTPFEHNSMTFLIEAPISVFREFHRHRVGWSYNEVSGRYRELDPIFYLPGTDRPLVQQGKPGHYEFVKGSDLQYEVAVGIMKRSYEEAARDYSALLTQGVAKEVARQVLPVGTYSAMYATCNARSLMHFLGLRTKCDKARFPSYPMHEIELVAKRMEKVFSELFPITWTAWHLNGRVSP